MATKRRRPSSPPFKKGAAQNPYFHTNQIQQDQAQHPTHSFAISQLVKELNQGDVGPDRHRRIPSGSQSGSQTESESEPMSKTSRTNPPLKRPHLCTLPPTCSRSHPTYLSSTEEMERHYSKFHAYVCESNGCGCVFPEERLLNLHFTECHDPLAALRRDRGEKIFACHLASCPRFFANPKSRRLHLISVHGYPPQYFFAVTNKGVGGLLKKWGEGVSMIRGEWKPRAEGNEAKMAVDQDGEDDEDEEESDEEDEDEDMDDAETVLGSKADQDDVMQALGGAMGSLSLVPPSIRFGRGGNQLTGNRGPVVGENAATKERTQGGQKPGAVRQDALKQASNNDKAITHSQVQTNQAHRNGNNKARVDIESSSNEGETDHDMRSQSDSEESEEKAQQSGGYTGRGGGFRGRTFHGRGARGFVGGRGARGVPGAGYRGGGPTRGGHAAAAIHTRGGAMGVSSRGGGPEGGAGRGQAGQPAPGLVPVAVIMRARGRGASVARSRARAMAMAHAGGRGTGRGVA